MAQGDVPTSPGGPFRRRREKRQLEHLVHESQREVSPSTARAHIKVLEEQDADGDQKAVTQAAEAPTEPPDEKGPAGFHVRAVPIDEPLDDT